MPTSNRTVLTARILCSLLAIAAFPGVGLTQKPAEAGHADHAKYVFLFIGDGMGAAQREMGRRLMNAQAMRDGQEAAQPKLVMDRLPATGTITTHSANSPVTDSAAAGTALATGAKTNNGMLCVTPDKLPVRTIAELLHDQGMKVGVLTSVYIDHATPASFYAHQPRRNNYKEISQELTASGFEFFGGGKVNGIKDDKVFADIVGRAGYSVHRVTKEALATLSPKTRKICVFGQDLAGSAMDYEIDRADDQPSLADFTRAAIKHLDGEDGFFIMVEGGRIDWACHGNDIATTAHGVLALDAAVGEAMAFYAKHPNQTLIVVTADHETGGLTLLNESDTGNALVGQKVSGSRFIGHVKQFRENNTTFDDALPVIQKYMLGKIDISVELREELATSFEASMSGDKDKEYKSLYGNYDALTITCMRILAAQSGAKWTTGGHTNMPVPVTAIGAGAAAFSGEMDNTDIPVRILEAVGIDATLPVPAEKADEAVHTDQPAKKAA